MAHYRLTVTVGRDTLARDELLAEGQLLLEFFTRGPLGGNSEPARRLVPDVLVDPVKAALQLLLTVDAPDALNGLILGLARINSAFAGTELALPTSIVTAEAEHVPDRSGPEIAPVHVDEA